MRKQFLLTFEGSREDMHHIDNDDLKTIIKGYYLEILSVKLQEIR